LSIIDEQSSECGPAMKYSSKALEICMKWKITPTAIVIIDLAAMEFQSPSPWQGLSVTAGLLRE
jgi:hypothetical protein